jgi:hypothetical protein
MRRALALAGAEAHDSAQRHFPSDKSEGFHLKSQSRKLAGGSWQLFLTPDTRYLRPKEQILRPKEGLAMTRTMNAPTEFTES